MCSDSQSHIDSVMVISGSSMSLVTDLSGDMCMGVISKIYRHLQEKPTYPKHVFQLAYVHMYVL